MADPIEPVDPWEPHLLPGLHPSDQERLSALFADVHPNDQIPADHPIDISTLGLPDHIVQAAISAPQLSTVPGDELENPNTPEEPEPPQPTDQPVTHPDGALLSPGPVTTPEFAPSFHSDEQTPITSPEQVGGTGELAAPTRPGETPQAPAPVSRDPFADDPLSNPDAAAGQKQLAEMAAKDPARFIAYSNDWQQQRARHFADQQLAAEQENQRRAEQDLRDRVEAEAATTKKMDALVAQSQALEATGGIKNDRWWSSRTTGQKVWSFIGAIAGGMRAGMKGSDGKNHFLDGIQHTIDQEIASQQFDVEQARSGLNFRRGIIGEEFARTGNLYQAAEAARLASYGSVLKELQAQQQLYDPRGTTAMSYAGQIADWQGRMAATKQALYDKQLDQDLKNREQLRKEAADAETMRHNMADEANARLKKGAGTGGGIAGAAIGKPTNPAFPVATGFFVDGQTVWARRAIGGKGEDPKERNELDTTLREYQHVNDQLIKMRRIAQEIGDGAKGLSESIWGARKTTLAADYDAAREAAISFMTKAIGDRPTQGQLELQAKRLPERQSVFAAQDPVALIDAQLEEADRSAIADLGTVGVDPTAVLESGKRKRAAAPAPAIIDEVAAAQEAQAKAKPGTAAYRDAAAELAQATARRADNMKQKAADKQNVAGQTAVAKFGAVSPTLDTEGLPADVRAEVTSTNQAIETQQRALAKLQELEKAKPKATGQKGTDLQVGGDRESAIAKQATVARDAATAVFIANNNTIRATIDHLDHLAPDKRKAIEDLADKYGAPHTSLGGGSVRRAWMLHAAIDEGAGVSPKYREGIFQVLGAPKDDLDEQVEKELAKQGTK